VVFIPKYRKKAVFGKIKKNLGAVFHDLPRRRECRIGGASHDGSTVGGDEETIRAYIRS